MPTIVNKSEERRAEDTKIQSSIDRASNQAKQEQAARAIEQRELQKAAGIDRVSSSSSSLTPSTPTPISSGSPTITGEPAPYNPPGQSKLETEVYRQSAEGYKATSGFQMSDVSMGFYNKAHNVAETIRTGVDTENFSKIPGSQVLAYPVRSTANLVEMGGMIPGGVETLVKKPEVIRPALTIGAYHATVGTGKAFKEDPLQTTSDIATGALLTGGAARAVPKVAGGIGSGVRTLAPKTQINIKPIVEPIIRPAKPTIDTALFSIETTRLRAAGRATRVTQRLPTEKISSGVNRIAFDAEMVKLRGKSGLKATGNKLTQGTRRATQRLPTEKISSGVNRIAFDAEVVKLRGKHGVQRLLVDESGQLVRTQVQPELLIRPRVKTKMVPEVTVKAKTQLINPAILAPGVITTSINATTTRQIQTLKRELVPDIAVTQVTEQLKTPIQIKVPIQRQVQIEDSVLKLRSTAIEAARPMTVKELKIPQVKNPETKRTTPRKSRDLYSKDWENPVADGQKVINKLLKGI